MHKYVDLTKQPLIEKNRVNVYTKEYPGYMYKDYSSYLSDILNCIAR